MPLIIKASASFNSQDVERFVSGIVSDYKSYFNLSLVTNIDVVRIVGLPYEVDIHKMRHTMLALGVSVRRQTLEERISQTDLLPDVQPKPHKDNINSNKNNSSSGNMGNGETKGSRESAIHAMDQLERIMETDAGEKDTAQTLEKDQGREKEEFWNDCVEVFGSLNYREDEQRGHTSNPREPHQPCPSSSTSPSPNVQRRSTTSSASKSSIGSNRASIESAITDEDDDHKYMLDVQRVREAEYMQDGFLTTLDISPEPRVPEVSDNRLNDFPLLAYNSPRSPRSPPSPLNNSHFQVSYDHDAAEEIRQHKMGRQKLESFINKYSSRRMYRDDDATNGLYSSRGDGAPDRIQVEHVPGVSIPVMLYGKDQDTIKSTPMPNNEMDIITMDDDEV